MWSFHVWSHRPHSLAQKSKPTRVIVISQSRSPQKQWPPDYLRHDRLGSLPLQENDWPYTRSRREQRPVRRLLRQTAFLRNSECERPTKTCRPQQSHQINSPPPHLERILRTSKPWSCHQQCQST